jgi:hypothetical protein
MSELHCERDLKKLTGSRARQRIQLIAHEIYISNAVYSKQLAFLEVLAQDAEVVVVYIALLGHRLHKIDDIFDRLPTERRVPISCNWGFRCHLRGWFAFRGAGPVVREPEVVFPQRLKGFGEDLVKVLKNLLFCDLSCLARSFTLLDTSARTNSAKQPSVHAVLMSLGPSCAMFVHGRAASSESGKVGLFEKEKSDWQFYR